jgi:tagatose-1,6-bisphosphate aldolase non-catalytic subunit AgaZ/GatZ
MIQHRLERLLATSCTLLGVGPMSANCVDSTIEMANEHDVPLMLIASRRQIDSAEFGGGYVNNWTTEQFAQYVIDNDKNGKVFLARDHGGPWQNPIEKEKKLSLRRAMESAKSSFKADLDAGFQILHIDPSVDIHGKPGLDEILDRIIELYEFCWSYSQQIKQKIIFEIGTEEQSGSTNTQDELNYTLEKMQIFCKKNHMPFPFFVVIQTGTRVMETRNVGSFDSALRVANEIPPEIQIPKMVEICNKYGVFIKAHNSDYLSDEALEWHPRLGIHSANVAPEFGVAETRALVGVLEDNNLSRYSDRFLQIAYESRKWTKWMLPATQASDREKGIIAGHYVFADPEVVELKNRAMAELVGKNIELVPLLKTHIKRTIFRYLRNFRLVRAL